MLGRAALATALVFSVACAKKDDQNVPDQGSTDTKTAPPAPDNSAKPSPEPTPTPAKADTHDRFNGDGFSLPIPEHYTAVTDEVRAKIRKQTGQQVDAALAKDSRDDGFRSSIVVTRIASNDIEPGDVKTCEVAAAQMAKAVGANVKNSPKAVSYGYGKSCQFEMGDDKQHAIQTIVYVDKNFWTMACNVSSKSLDKGRKECEQALAGFGR